MTQPLADQIGSADIARVREERDRELSGKHLDPMTTGEMQAEAYRQVLGSSASDRAMPHDFKLQGESYAEAYKRWDQYQIERARASLFYEWGIGYFGRAAR